MVATPWRTRGYLFLLLDSVCCCSLLLLRLLLLCLVTLVSFYQARVFDIVIRHFILFDVFSFKINFLNFN